MKGFSIVILGICGFTIGFLAIILILTIGIFYMVAPFKSHTCHVYGQLNNYKVRYQVVGAECYVKTPSGWFEWDQIKQNNVSKP